MKVYQCFLLLKALFAFSTSLPFNKNMLNDYEKRFIGADQMFDFEKRGFFDQLQPGVGTSCVRFQFNFWAFNNASLWLWRYDVKILWFLAIKFRKKKLIQCLLVPIRSMIRWNLQQTVPTRESIWATVQNSIEDRLFQIVD